VTFLDFTPPPSPTAAPAPHPTPSPFHRRRACKPPPRPSYQTFIPLRMMVPLPPGLEPARTINASAAGSPRTRRSQPARRAPTPSPAAWLAPPQFSSPSGVCSWRHRRPPPPTPSTPATFSHLSRVRGPPPSPGLPLVKLPPASLTCTLSHGRIHSHARADGHRPRPYRHHHGRKRPLGEIAGGLPRIEGHRRGVETVRTTTVRRPRSSA